MLKDVNRPNTNYPEILEAEYQGKYSRLNDAIRKYLEPGMTLRFAGGIGGPGAAIREIISRFFGKNPRFILVQGTITGHGLNILHCGLVSKIIIAACVDITPSGRPCKLSKNLGRRRK